MFRLKLRFTCVHFFFGLLLLVCLYHPSSRLKVVIMISSSLFASPWIFFVIFALYFFIKCTESLWVFGVILVFHSLSLLFILFYASLIGSRSTWKWMCCAFHVVFGWIFNSYTLWGFQFSWWDVAHVFKLLFQPTNLDCIKHKMR